MVIEVLPRYAAKAAYRVYLVLQPSRAVDHDVAVRALQQVGTDLERGSEPQRLRWGDVQFRDDRVHGKQLLYLRLGVAADVSVGAAAGATPIGSMRSEPYHQHRSLGLEELPETRASCSLLSSLQVR
jgi:hypothetical protein